MEEISKTVDRKLAASIGIEGYSIMTDEGWKPVTDIHQTVEYQEWRLSLVDGRSLVCADNHIVFLSNGDEVFVRDLKSGDVVLTDTGPSIVHTCELLDSSSNMYDVTVEGHKFYTDGILSHNTTVAMAAILHYILFNEYKLVAILANKGDAAREVLDRIKIAYEALPQWLQQGVVVWNKGSIELENGCKAIAAATSSSAIRGKAVSYLYIDECVVGDTICSVKDTISGVISDITIEELHDRLEGEPNSIYEVATHEGFKKFTGVNSTITQLTYKLSFEDGTHLEVTAGHKILMEDGEFAEARILSVGDATSSGKIISHIDILAGEKRVYDLSNVEDTQSYFTNGVVSHNCAFIANWDEFFSAVYPTISSGKSTKVLMTSCVTPDTLVWDKQRGLVEVGSYIEDNGIEDPTIGYEVPEYSIYGHRKFNTGRVMVNSGDAKIKHIKTAFTELKCSEDHKLWAKVNGVYGWYYAKHLLEGDMVSIEAPSNHWVGTFSVDDPHAAGEALREATHIPEEYTRQSKADIIDFVSGLIDEDCEFASHHEKIIDQVRSILLSLGILTEKQTNKCGFILSIFDPVLWETVRIRGDAFTLPTNAHMVDIVSIEDGFGKVFDFSLDHIEEDGWCHSVLYNGLLGHQTPNGINHYHKICKEAQEEVDENGEGKNGYKYIEVPWHRVPDRDEAWKKKTLASMSFDHEKFEQEFNCVTGDTIIEVVDANGVIHIDTIENISEMIGWK